MQGVSAALAGTVAQLTSPASAMTVMAATSVSVTFALAAAGRRQKRRPGVAGDDKHAVAVVLEVTEVEGGR